jgi:hypothetical protein
MGMEYGFVYVYYDKAWVLAMLVQT